MKTALLIPLVAAALTAGCNRNSVDEKNASVADVANAVAKAGSDLKFNPGRWESTVSIVDVAMPGVPKAMAAEMQSAMAKERKVATCLTREEAEKPNAGFFNRDSKQCTYDHFTLGNGKIDSKMTCGTDPAHRATVVMAGTYSRDRYAMDMTSDVPGPKGQMTMHMKVAAARVGDCKGDEFGAATK